jgi:predicted GNAT family acetyltransferase
MEVRRSDDAGAFAERVRPFLLRDEARHNLVLGVLDTLVRHPDVYPEFMLWTLEDEGEIVAVATRTPPFNLLISQPGRPGAGRGMAEALHGAGVELPGVTGARPEAEEFAARWGALSGTRARLRMGMGVYRLTVVRPVAGVRGRMRQADSGDKDLLVAWMDAFQHEALAHIPGDDLGEWVDHRLRLDGGQLFVWEDPDPVSLAGWGQPTPSGVRVGPVYTPPERRRRGYASALVAEMSSMLLARGHRFCFLFTDLANPTSNKIYQDVGYEFVCESADLVFE